MWKGQALFIDQLTETEQKVYQLMLEYKSNAEIAEILNYTVPTVRQIVHSIYQKMGINHRANYARLIFLRKVKGVD